MTIRTTLICICIGCAFSAAHAQAWSSTDATPAYDAVRSTTNAADKSLLVQADQSRSALEHSLKGYVVAFDTAQLRTRPRVGLPLASFADSGLELAYDLSGQSVMARWRLSQRSAGGKRFETNVFVDANGAASMVFSSRF